MNRILLLVILIGSIFLEEANAQSFYNFGRQRTLLFSGGIGNATYFGDLKDQGDNFDSKFNITAGLQYFVTPRVSVRGDLTWFQLEGADEDSGDKGRNRRNLSFQSSNFELSFTGTINLFENPARMNSRPVFNAYAFLGLGLLYTNPTAELDGKRHALQPLKTEGVSYSRLQPVIPYGLGIRIKAHPFVNVVIEGGYRQTFTDYLDDVSTVHPDKSTWDPTSVRYRLSDRSVELGVPGYDPGKVRGNSSDNDGYFLLNLKIEYYLPNNFLFKQGNQRKLYNRKRKSFR